MDMPAPIFVRLPLKNISRGECNTVVYEARKDLRPADGSLEILTVVDNTRFNERCRSARVVPVTEVHYETVSSGMSGRVGTTHSSFTADKLQPGFGN